MIKHILTGTAAAIFLTASAASAATLSLIGPSSEYVTHTLTGNDLGFNGAEIQYLTGDVADGDNGLSVSGDAFVQYTFLGFEAGNSNETVIIGSTEFVNGSTTPGTKSSIYTVLSGLLDFAFKTTAPGSAVGNLPNNTTATPASNDYAIGYLKITDNSYYAFFDDIAKGDRDFDDIGIMINVASVPLPAGGLLLLSALGGAAALRRRKKAA